MTVKRKIAVYDYETLSQITGKSLKAVYQDVTRGNLDLDDLKSVIVYVSRHAQSELKGQILLAITERDLDLSVASKKRKAFLKKRSASRQKKKDEDES